jgi:hypothetical protein
VSTPKSCPEMLSLDSTLLVPLYEVAIGILSQGEVAPANREILRHQPIAPSSGEVALERPESSGQTPQEDARGS